MKTYTFHVGFWRLFTVTLKEPVPDDNLICPKTADCYLNGITVRASHSFFNSSYLGEKLYDLWGRISRNNSYRFKYSYHPSTPNAVIHYNVQEVLRSWYKNR